MKAFFSEAAPAVILFAFIIVVLSVSHQNSVGNCERINQAITESNSRIPAHNAEKAVVRSFLKSASNARLAEYRRSHQASDLKAAIEYQTGIATLDENVRFHTLPPINCRKAINFIP